MLRLSSAPVVSIAKIRGRTYGIGNEFVLACDMRFASRQTAALFGNPEIGVGLVPSGGALEWLPCLVGRSRALEISASTSRRSGGQTTMTRKRSPTDRHLDF